MAGVFPEFLHRLKTSRAVVSADALLDFIRVGKRSYQIVSEFTYGPYGPSAPLFRKLSERRQEFPLTMMQTRTFWDPQIPQIPSGGFPF